MKYYPPHEWQHCYAVACRYSSGEDLKLRDLLAEQRAGAYDAGHRAGFEAGVAREHDRLTDGDWNEATAANLWHIRASEKHYGTLLEACQAADLDPERALELVRQWNREQAVRMQEFEAFMREIEVER